MFLHVLDVMWLKDHELKIEFDDGSMKRVDLSDELEGEVFEPLRDPAYGAGFAPEFLHEKGEGVEQVA